METSLRNVIPCAAPVYDVFTGVTRTVPVSLAFQHDLLNDPQLLPTIVVEWGAIHDAPTVVSPVERSGGQGVLEIVGIAAKEATATKDVVKEKAWDEVGHVAMGEVGREAMGEVGHEAMGEVGREAMGEVGHEAMGEAMGEVGHEAMGEVGHEAMGEVGHEAMGEVGHEAMGEAMDEVGNGQCLLRPPASTTTPRADARPPSPEPLPTLQPDIIHVNRIHVSLPTVSIVMTTYNCAKYIEHAVRSLQAQTLTNWELVVVDDRSTDATDAVIRVLAQEDDRIVYLRNCRNIGCYASKNIGVYYARGRWLTFHDADDYSMSDRLEKQLAFCARGRVKGLTGSADLDIGELRGGQSDVYDCCYATSLARQDKVWSWLPITMFLRTETFKSRLGAFDLVRFGADSEMRERMATLEMRVGVLDDYLYACPDRWIEIDRREASLTGDRRHDPIRLAYREAFMRFHLQARRQLTGHERSKTMHFTFPPHSDDSDEALKHKRPFPVIGLVGDAEAEKRLFPSARGVHETVALNKGE